LKVNENLIRRKTEAAKVVAVEREKKKMHDASPAAELEKKMVSKRKISSASEQKKDIVVEEQQPEGVKLPRKKARLDPFAKTDDDMDILATPQLELSSCYPPKAKELEGQKELPTTAPLDLEEVAEREARSKPAVEILEKQILMEAFAGLMDVVDETEELCYIDDDTSMETSRMNPSTSVLDENKTKPTPDEGQGSGLKTHDPINLGSTDIEQPRTNLSRSPPPSLDEIEKQKQEIDGGVMPLCIPRVMTLFC
jgi:hypothetical protein